jgi:Tol biopolymer transport system component
MQVRILNTQDFALLDLRTKTTRPLTRLNNADTIRTFDVAPDGKQIVFDRVRDNSDRPPETALASLQKFKP